MLNKELKLNNIKLNKYILKKTLKINSKKLELLNIKNINKINKQKKSKLYLLKKTKNNFYINTNRTIILNNNKITLNIKVIKSIISYINKNMNKFLKNNIIINYNFNKLLKYPLLSKSGHRMGSGKSK
jgi:hypothetical protein